VLGEIRHGLPPLRVPGTVRVSFIISPSDVHRIAESLQFQEGWPGDPLQGGWPPATAARLRRFADGGVTDLSVRLLPIGQGRDELVASKHRIRDMLAALAENCE
jgi:hypothetical protein